MKKIVVCQKTVTFIQYMYPGLFFAETSYKKVRSRNVKQKFPKDAYAYRFYDQDVLIMPNNEEVEMGDPYNFSGLYFQKKGSRVFTLEQVKKQFPQEKILISNMEINKYEKAIKTHLGNWQEFKKEDRAV